MRHVDFSPLYRSTVGFDRLFTMLDTLGQPDNGQSYPPYNIERTAEDAYRISMAVAGFSDDEISIEAHRNVLTIKGEKKEEKELKDKDVHRRERAYGYFRRSIEIPADVDADKITATYRKGVLTIDLPKTKQPQEQARHIEVKAA